MARGFEKVAVLRLRTEVKVGLEGSAVTQGKQEGLGSVGASSLSFPDGESGRRARGCGSQARRMRWAPVLTGTTGSCVPCDAGWAAQGRLAGPAPSSPRPALGSPEGGSPSAWACPTAALCQAPRVHPTPSASSVLGPHGAPAAAAPSCPRLPTSHSAAMKGL